MFWFLYIIIFLISCILLYFSGELVVNNLVKISRYLGVKEFIIAFFIMAFAASIPNFILGIDSALKGIPGLSLGDIFGNNLIALTLAVALGVLFSKKKEIPIQNETVRGTAKFTVASAILPLILLSDGILSRMDGLVLVCFFFIYLFWVFSKRNRFSIVHKTPELSLHGHAQEFKEITISLFFVSLGVIFIFLAAQGIIYSASFFAISSGLSLVLVGLLVTGFGNALPEIYFSIISARRGDNFMILGNLMGSIIFPATLVLGTVAIISPIQLLENSPFLLINRIFMITATLFFYLFSRTHNKIVKFEAYALILLYILFVLSVFILI